MKDIMEQVTNDFPKVYLEYDYVTSYPLHLCLDYIKHENVGDVFYYTWEEQEDYYLITFKEYRNSSFYSLHNAPKPEFRVMFKSTENGTTIHVQFLSQLLQPVPFVTTYQIDEFWERKLEAKRIK